MGGAQAAHEGPARAAASQAGPTQVPPAPLSQEGGCEQEPLVTGRQLGSVRRLSTGKGFVL